MNITTTPLRGLLIIEPPCFQDERGYFVETYQESRYRKVGIQDSFVQDNHSRSDARVLRGLHFLVRARRPKS